MHRSACLNCAETLLGDYCHRCGQEDRNPDPTIQELASTLVAAVLNWDSRLFLTLRTLLFHPGRATAEFNRGRRALYMSPVRFYVVVSVMFLTAATLAGGLMIERMPLALPESNQMTDARMAWGWLVRGFGWSMFLLVPAFAGLLKLLYLRSGRLYAHHLVLALNYHAFAFLILTPLILFAQAKPGVWLAYVAALIFLWIVVWPIFAMREAYGGGWWVTVTKAGTLLWLYFTIVVPLGTIPMAFLLALILGGEA